MSETAATVLRYSPHPIEDYSGDIQVDLLGGNKMNLFYGPANDSALAGDTVAWNLAWLSHPYEKYPNPELSRFGELVADSLTYGSKTAREIWDLRWLFSQPAPFAVRMMLEKGCSGLPLFEVYGNTWLDTIKARQWLCRGDNEESGNLEVAPSTPRMLSAIFRKKP